MISCELIFFISLIELHLLLNYSYIKVPAKVMVDKDIKTEYRKSSNLDFIDRCFVRRITVEYIYLVEWQLLAFCQ